MCFPSTPAPDLPDLPPPSVVDESVTSAKEKARQAAALAAGRSSTQLTGGQGVQTPGAGAGKALLGT